jgi:hypothetical protein
MAFFYSFTESLKQKWLQFFQANHDWIMLHMQVESVYTPDGGKRPPSYLILGVANALEPKLAQLMLPFSKLNPDADTLVEVLGLHFDPNVALGNSAMPKIEDEISETADKQSNGLSDPTASSFTASDFTMDDTNHEMGITATQPNTIEESHNGFGNLSDISAPSIDSPQLSGLDGINAFGDNVSFEIGTPVHEKMDFQGLEDINASEEHGFGDVLMDVWSEEGQAKKGEAGHEMSLGDDFSSTAFDDSEIARLFPNS